MSAARRQGDGVRTDPAGAQRRAAVVVYGLAALITVLVVVFAVQAITDSRQVPVLDGPRGALAEALRWPWPTFPGVAPVERQTIRRQFRLDEPLFAARVLPWTAAPDHPALRPRTAAGRRELAAALDRLRAVRPPEPGAVAGLGPGGEVDAATTAALDAALEALDRVDAGRSSWVVRYDRGVLYLWRGAHAPARAELEAAARLLRSARPGAGSAARARAEFWSAYAHTYYALGHALLRGGLGEEDGENEGEGEGENGDGGEAAGERRDEAVRTFRLAVIGAVQVAEQGDRERYPGVTSSLRFFRLRPTGLSTGALTNDLVAAYLAHREFHDCPERPDGWPCGSVASEQTLDEDAACGYRDKIFCASVRRTGPPFGAPFVELMRQFYAGGDAAWGEESRLWALSNAVDRTAANLDLGDPYLLYNLGSLLVEQGRFGDAAGYLERALDQVTGDMPDADLERLERLATVGQVLAGRSPRGGSAQHRQPSTLRALYRELYEGRDDLPTDAFPPVGGAFEPDAESLIDRWLFLQLWRAQLAAGDVESFAREYARVVDRPGVPGDFFETWRRQVMADLGRRALARADDYAVAGEADQARRIRFFVSESGHFPPGVAHDARTARGWLTWGGRRLAQPIVLVAALLLLAALWCLARGLVRAHRSLFLSAHHRDRVDRHGEDVWGSDAGRPADGAGDGVSDGAGPGSRHAGSASRSSAGGEEGDLSAGEAPS